MANGVLVFVEQRENRLRKAGIEALSEGRRIADSLGQPLSALIVGGDVKGLTDEVSAQGANKIYLAQSATFEKYSTEGYTAALAMAIEQAQPSVVLLTHSSHGKDLAPRVAARLNLGLATDVTDIKVADGKVTAVRPVYAGKAYTTVEFNTTPAFMTTRPNVFPVGESKSGNTSEIVGLSVPITVDAIRANLADILADAGKKIDLTEAKVVVSGGRGIRGPENYHLIEELADALGGAAGASRAIVDAGWVDHSHQVGQTGKTVSPQLYIAAGISGAIQHLAGMSSSKYIVAINKDAEAPIFKVADYGIVGDLFDIVPRLIEQAKHIRSQQ
jgi:electron transfer flavoprotein alpha subunit